MTPPEHQRRVTRTFVLALAGFVTLFALALLVASWGLLSFALGTKPVESDLPFQTTPLVISLAVLELFWLLWRFALTILRGTAMNPWLFALITATLAYLTFGTLEVLAGLSPREAFLTVYPFTLFLAWFVAVPLFFVLLTRQVYTNRPAPMWPWERREREERERELFQRLENERRHDDDDDDDENADR